MRLSTALFVQVVVLFSSAVIAFPVNEKRAEPSLNDPFYKPPKGFAKEKNGAILRSRAIAMPSLTSANQTFQILYRTTAQNGSAIAEVVSIATPKTPVKGKKQQLLALQTPTDSAAAKCNPSYQLTGANDEGSVATGNINTALDAGMVVITPDYESQDAGFVAGLLSGMGTLDAIRATLDYSKVITKPKKDVLVAMTGYSGGALASGWAAQIAHKYAPELNFTAVAVGGLTVNIKHITLNLNNGVESGLALAGFAGTANVFSDWNKFLTKHLTAKGKKAIADVRNSCLGIPLILKYNGVDIFDYLDISRSKVLASSVVKALFKATTLGGDKAAVPHMPYYAYWSAADEVIVPADLEDYLKDICSRGAHVTKKKYASGSHQATAGTGFPDALTFIQDRFAGKSVSKKCVNA